MCIVLAAIMLSAGKKNAPHNVELAPLIISFDNVVGDKDLALNADYTNAAGESFTITQLQYFISNIKLKKTDGTAYAIVQDSSYFLVQENNPSTHIIRLKVPEADYSGLEFVLGIDSIRNTMGISKRTGVLDPASSMDNGMYWGWNSGYIFFKMEGTSPAAPADPTGSHKFRYHIGGFGGYSASTINNIKAISLDFSSGGTAMPRKERNIKIHVKADVLRTFEGSGKVSIAAHPSVMFSEYSVNIANNYSKMFVHHRTEN